MSLDFVDQGGMVGCKDGVEVNGFPCQECEPLLFREFRAFRRIGEATSGSFEVKHVVFNEFKSEL